MKLKELKTILNNTPSIHGVFTDTDIDYFINNLEDEKNHEYIKINNVTVPFRRICIGLQKLSDNMEDTELLFIYDFKQVQIKISDIESIEFVDAPMLV